MICSTVFEDLGQKFTITSVCDGVHKVGSRHYIGFAFDLRTFNLRKVSAIEVGRRLQDALGDNWQVLLESDHLHVECKNVET